MSQTILGRDERMAPNGELFIPFAGDDLVGNIATETIVSALLARGVDPGIRPDGLQPAIAMTEEIRAKYSHEVSPK